MKTYFSWTCQHCKHKHDKEQVDSEQGPFVTLVCDSCDKPSGFGDLSEKDADAWDQAIHDAQEG